MSRRRDREAGQARTFWILYLIISRNCGHSSLRVTRLSLSGQGLFGNDRLEEVCGGDVLQLGFEFCPLEEKG